MPSLVEFLRAVLPSEGVYCAFVLPAKRNYFFPTIDALAAFMLEQDHRGHTVYHACASYKNGSSRTAANVNRVRALWLDVDAGAGKPYRDATDTWGAVERFRRTYELPRPIYVGSGTGLHVYWPLQTELSVGEWRSYAEGLKRACREAVLLAGPERTADAASILRPPGTWHRKDVDNPKLVEVGEIVGPYKPSLFHFLNSISTRPVRNIDKHERLSSLARACIVDPDYPPADAEQIAESCAQLAHMRDTGGVMPEPEWKACINVLAFCEDGRKYAHDWSKGDTRYDPGETNAKFDRGSLLGGPTSCDFLSALNERCRSCIHRGRIRSPIELGRVRHFESHNRATVEPVQEGIKLPTIGGFKYEAGALVLQTENKKGEPEQKLITQYPVFIERVNRSETATDNYSAVFRHKPPQEGWQSIELPLKTFFGPGGIPEIMGKGVIVHDGDLFRRFVRESLDQINSSRKASVQYEQFGWKDEEESFLVGRRLYRAHEIVEVDGTPELNKRSKELVPTPKGSLEAWKEASDRLFARGVEPQGFTCWRASLPH